MSHTEPAGLHDATSRANGESTLHDLFALSDEQILEIEPEAAGAVQVGQPPLAVQEESAPAPVQKPESDAPERISQASIQQEPAKDAQAGMPAPLEPPKWLANMMGDPQAGEAARDFWDGIQHTRQEAAAYREVFAKPEEARAAAERSRQLETIDGLYFAGDATAREQLARTLLQQDPAAFREMVFAGLRALERTGAPVAQAGVAQAFRPEGVPISGTVPTGEQKPLTPEGVSYNNTHLTAYAAFERAANADLEREVGGTITRALEQALPGTAKSEPVRDRLASAIRQDIEAALKGDQQLGAQVALILRGGRPGEAGTQTPRLDDATRALVVRLIGERARQLVPGAAKRVLGEWTQTALAAHRARTQKAETTATRRDVEGVPSLPESARSRTRGSREIDYRKLSDEQILNM